jgi:uncharacterized damage-inducible protein DinB
MYKTVQEFVNDWTRESELSLKVERALTDASLSQRTDPEGRTLGDIAWHMAVMIGLTGSGIGLSIEAPPRGTAVPGEAATIASAYERAKESFRQQAATSLTDGKLVEEIEIFGRKMSRAAALNGLVRHQIHHRGQMTVLMRGAGLVVPSVYGPSREESAAMRAKQGR